jgi:TfoX/Sxy family transcriptional regulator of competence genes
MAYNEQLAERVRTLLADSEDASDMREQKMFGGICFMWRGNMLVGVHEERLLIRIPREQTEATLKQPRVHPFDITGRPMQGWLSVEAEAVKTKPALTKWIERSRSYVATLPPK